VQAYGRWMRDEAQRRIGHLYPDAVGPNGEILTPIAWIWARTVKSPDPAWKGHVPLVVSWVLRNKAGKPKVWVEPIVDRVNKTISYEVRVGGEPTHERTVGRGGGVCVATGTPFKLGYIRDEGRAGRMGSQLLAVVAEGLPKGRVCLAPNIDHHAAADVDFEITLGSMPRVALGFRTQAYGMDQWEDLFTPRQLLALSTFSDLLGEVREIVTEHAANAGMATGEAGSRGYMLGSGRTGGQVAAPDTGAAGDGDGVRLRDGGAGAAAYADAVVTYLAFAVDKCADYWSTVCTWMNHRETLRNTFGRQAIPMTWDFAEANPLSGSTGNWMANVDWVRKVVAELPAGPPGEALQRNARARLRENPGSVVSTDPPYYDNVPYADLSDFFYIWLRRNLSGVWPDECSTLLTPKAEEMIANPFRAGSKTKAADHFEQGMADFMAEVAITSARQVPATIFYAYKATESLDGETTATGWATFLQGVVDAGMQVTATWPMRTENQSRLRAMKSNALASSIVLACRPRSSSARMASRTEFLTALRSELPDAVKLLQTGIIAPVDMAQSAIGPGIAVFSRYAKVVEADGSAMPVSDALAIINDVLGEILDGEEAELDNDSRFAVAWYAQYGYEAASSGDADNLARAKNTALAGIEQSGIGEARAGRFRLYRRDELPEGWSPLHDERLTVWEATQHLVAALERDESQAASLIHQLGGYSDRARQLAYVLYAKADGNGWAEEAAAYNGLIAVWSDLLAMGDTRAGQGTML